MADLSVILEEYPVRLEPLGSHHFEPLRAACAEDPDTRNTRSMAAVIKLGAVHEGTLRRNRVTWTDYVRDTAVFGLLREDWAG